MVSLETIAIEIRQEVRAKAGLKPDWDRASPEMKDWYRYLAKEWARSHAPEETTKTQT